MHPPAFSVRDAKCQEHSVNESESWVGARAEAEGAPNGAIDESVAEVRS